MPTTQHRLPMTLTQAAATLPPRRGGRKVAVATLYRWTSSGCRGVRLNYVQVGGTRCVSTEMLSDFFDRLKATNQHTQQVPSQQRTSQQAATSAVLDKILGPVAPKS